MDEWMKMDEIEEERYGPECSPYISFRSTVVSKRDVA
jgi:hypothetical protein